MSRFPKKPGRMNPRPKGATLDSAAWDSATHLWVGLWCRFCCGGKFVPSHMSAVGNFITAWTESIVKKRAFAPEPALKRRSYWLLLDCTADAVRPRLKSRASTPKNQL